jgi:excisionase family DNA binding protein
MTQTVQATDADTEKLVEAAVVAAALGVCETTVRRMASRGELPSIALGPRLMRFNLSQVLAALQSRSGPLTVPCIPEIQA